MLPPSPIPRYTAKLNKMGKAAIASKEERVVIWSWEGRGKGELSGVKVMTYFTGVWVRWCAAHLSRLMEWYVEDLCVSLYVNFT